jgi:ADP-ribose pyrophosphatase YjhB (NUDIX family)
VPHCYQCGSALDTKSIDGQPRKVCPSCGHIHWENPTPAIGGVLVRDGNVLLCRRGREPKKGQWDLPGGFLELGESAEEGLRREIREETGLEVEAMQFLDALPGTYDSRGTLNLMYAVEAAGEPAADDDVDELRWWPLDALPQLAWEHEAQVLRTAAARQARHN